MSQSVNRITTERNQRTLLELVQKPGNDVCADCKARTPRWASHNLGIFICVNCASIHRKMGTHISKVKSVTLDSWTKEQVESMKQNGNNKSNSYYNPNESRNPPPTNMMESERDSELEKFIRAKYQYKKFIDKFALVASHLGPSESLSDRIARPQSTPVVNPPPSMPPSVTPTVDPTPKLDYRSPPPSNPSLSYPSQIRPTRSVSQPLTSQAIPQQQQPSFAPPPKDSVWSDLISLQGPSQSSSLPLQFQATTPSVPTMPSLAISSMITTNNYPPSASPGYPSQPSFLGGMGPTSAGVGVGSTTNPFQQPGFNSGAAAPPMFSGGNPFNSMYSPAGGGFGGIGQPSPFAPQQSFVQQERQQFLQPQPQIQSPMPLQGQTGGNPFLQPQQSFATQPPFSVGPPSPFAPPIQQVPSTGNPFGQWQHNPQGGYQGQSWGGM